METTSMRTTSKRRPQGPDARRPRNDRARAVMARDAALERIVRARRWIIVGSLALTGALAGLASALLPGKSFAASKASAANAKSGSTTAPTARVSRAASGAPALPAAAGPSQLGLNGPVQAPAPSQSSPPPASTPAPAPAASGGGGAVVSGGS
jgi:hypothetical protein